MIRGHSKYVTLKLYILWTHPPLVMFFYCFITLSITFDDPPTPTSVTYFLNDHLVFYILSYMQFYKKSFKLNCQLVDIRLQKSINAKACTTIYLYGRLKKNATSFIPLESNLYCKLTICVKKHCSCTAIKFKICVYIRKVCSQLP